MLLNCLIIDDEPIARQGILEHISEIEFLNPVAACKDVIEAMNILEKHQIDVLFIDIQMPKISGIEFIKNLKKPIPTIFTTAYSEHALEGYELGVLDYLLKPITYTRFLKAAFKVKEYYTLLQLKNGAPLSNYFFVKCDQRIEKILFQDVLYIEGLANYIAIHTIGKKYITYLTFKALEEKLPMHHFIRIHKSYLVSIDAIQSIETDQVLLHNIALPLSKTYKVAVMEQINKNLFKRSSTRLP